MTRKRTARRSASHEAKRPASRSAPQSALDDDRSPPDYPRPADPMRASIAYSLRGPGSPGGAHPDLLRLSLFRKMMTVMGHPARCKDAACRRSGACVGPTIRCERENPPRDVAPDREQRNLALLQRALRQRVEDIERERSARRADGVSVTTAAASRRRSRAWSRSAGRT